MATFKFIGHQKEAVWKHYPITVEATDYDEARAKLRKAVFDCEGLFHIWNEDNDVTSDWHNTEIVECGEFIYPEANYGNPTIRIRDEFDSYELDITNTSEGAQA
jgi:hypothetical protein